MSETTGATGGEAVSVDLPADAPEEFTNVNDAAKYFTELTEKRNKSPAESAEPATAEQKLSGEDNAAPVEKQAHGEDQEADPAAKPPIERPKSWTESEDAEWQATPRALQEKIVARELERDTALRRTQNEAADKLKGLTAKEQAAEQARQQYEARLPELMQALYNTNNSQFADIKNQDDADRLGAEDPFRWIQWRAHQDRMAGTFAALREAQGKQAQEQQAEWTNHVQTEIAKAAEAIPELADDEKKAALIGRAEKEFLPALGFSKSEIDALSIGKQKLSIFDHRILKLISDGMKYADIKAAPKAIAAKPVPAVVRPGVSRPSGQDASEREQALTRKDELSVAEATELYSLQQNRQRRAS